MVGVTLLGLVLTPVFYVATRSVSLFAQRLRARRGGPGVAPAE
jgi:hypothetical protein